MKNRYSQPLKEKNSQIVVCLSDLIQLKNPAKSINLIHTKRLVAHRMGGYSASLRGRGIDFSEVRNYQFGDDAGAIDWRVTARIGEPHIKVFHEERDRSVFLLVDYSPSMFFGSRVTFKSVVAAKAAALLAWAADLEGDRVGAFICFENKSIELRPRSRFQGVLPLLKTLADQSNSFNVYNKSCSSDHDENDSRDNCEGMTLALARLQRVAHPGCLIFILSDFKRLNHEDEMIIGQLSRHSEIMAGFISDPLEQYPPLANQYSIGNGKKTLIIDTTQPEICEAYRSVFQQRHIKIQKLFKKYRVPMFELSTQNDVTESLLKQLGNMHHSTVVV